MSPAPAEAIWQEHAHQLRGFIYRRIPDPSLVEDLLQEVFLKVQTKLDTLKDETRVQNWLYQITRNTIIDHFRSRKHEEELPETLDLPEPEVPRILNELAECVRPMLNALPQEYREPLQLSDLEGLPLKQVADRLGISLTATKSRVQRGRKRLKDLFTQCCQFELDHRGSIIGYNAKDDSCKGC
jgi:RNA polymerase sigma-70 factor, ECF subfamily